MQDTNGAIAAQLEAIVVTVQTGPPSVQQSCQNPVEAFDDDMENLLDSGSLPALDIMLRSAPAWFNYQSTLKSMIPMAFGAKGTAHLSPGALLTATRELDGAVGVLIEERFLSTLDPRRT